MVENVIGKEAIRTRNDSATSGFDDGRKVLLDIRQEKGE